jgi:CBS domain-containing protein
MKVENILREKGAKVITTRPTASVKSAADRLRMENIAALVVTENDAVVGLISEREIVRAYSQYGEQLDSKLVKDIMTTAVLCSPDDDLRHVMAAMTRFRARHLVVTLPDGQLAGIISIGDVVKHRLSDLELETNVLRDAYLAGH